MRLHSCDAARGMALDKTAIVNAEFVGVTLDFQVTNPVATWTLNRGDNYLNAGPDATKIKSEVDRRPWTVTAIGVSTEHTGHMISPASCILRKSNGNLFQQWEHQVTSR